MEKKTAIDLLGGSVTSAALACDISPSAISQWPDILTKDQTHRVQAALWRKQEALRTKRTPELSFIHDESLERGERMAHLLDIVREQDAKKPE